MSAVLNHNAMTPIMTPISAGMAATMGSNGLQMELFFDPEDMEVRMLQAGMANEAAALIQAGEDMPLEHALALAELNSPDMDPELSEEGEQGELLEQVQGRLVQGRLVQGGDVHGNDFFSRYGYRMLAIEMLVSAVTDSWLRVREGMNEVQAADIQVIREEAIEWIKDGDTPTLSDMEADVILDDESGEYAGPGGGLTFLDCCEAIGIAMPNLQESFRQLCLEAPSSALNRLRMARKAVYNHIHEDRNPTEEQILQPGEKPGWAKSVEAEEAALPTRKLFLNEKGEPLNPFEQYKMREQMRAQEREREQLLAQVAEMYEDGDFEDEGIEDDIDEDEPGVPVTEHEALNSAMRSFAEMGSAH